MARTGESPHISKTIMVSPQPYRGFADLGIDNPIWRGSSTSIFVISRILISLTSVVFLIVPMLALTYIQPTGFILLAASLFSVFFAIIVAISSKARNHEVFGVTAAYSAVLMVFVGNAVQIARYSPNSPS